MEDHGGFQKLGVPVWRSSHPDHLWHSGVRGLMHVLRPRRKQTSTNRFGYHQTIESLLPFLKGRTVKNMNHDSKIIFAIITEP